MKISFADNKLNKIVNDDKKLVREWLEIIGVEIIEIVNYHKER